MASITALPMLLAFPVLALLSFLAARLLRLLRALRGSKSPSSLPPPASASVSSHVRPTTKTHWARVVPAAFVARVPGLSLGRGLSFPRVPWVRVASDAPDLPRGQGRRDSTLIELLPTSAPPPPPMASPPPTRVFSPPPSGVFAPPTEAESHQLVDVSDPAGPSDYTSPPVHPPSYLYPAPHAQALTQTYALSGPRPAHFIPAPKALSSPNTRAASPLTRLATTPPPPPHRRSRSLGGVPVRRLSGGSSSGSGSGLRHAVGTHEGILIDFSSSGDGADADGEEGRGASAVSSSSAVSDIALAGKAPSGTALLPPHPIAPLVDISDDPTVNEKTWNREEREGGVDDAAWRWFGTLWTPPVVVSGHAPSVTMKMTSVPVPVQVYSAAAAAAVSTILAPRAPKQRADNALDAARLADVELEDIKQKGPLGEDPFADPIPVRAPLMQDKEKEPITEAVDMDMYSAWHQDARGGANHEEEDEYAAEQRALAYAEDPFADPVPSLLPSPLAHAPVSGVESTAGGAWWDAPVLTLHEERVGGREGALVDVDDDALLAVESAAVMQAEKEDAPWWDMPVPAPAPESPAAHGALSWDTPLVDVEDAPLVDIEGTPLVDVDDVAPPAAMEDAPWWDMPAPRSVREADIEGEEGVAQEKDVAQEQDAPWWDVPVSQESANVEGPLISLDDAVPHEDTVVSRTRELEEETQDHDNAQESEEQEQAWPDPALMDLPSAAPTEAPPSIAYDFTATAANDEHEDIEAASEAYPDPELLPLPVPISSLAPAIISAGLPTKPVIEPAPASPVSARAGHAPLSQTPTPPASPPPVIAHPRALRTLAFTLTTEDEKDASTSTLALAPDLVGKMIQVRHEDKENAPPSLALTIPRSSPSVSRSTSRSASRAASPSPSSGAAVRPAWSRRADDAPALGLASSSGNVSASGAERRVLGDAKVNAGAGGEAEAEAVTVVVKEVPSVKVTFAPKEEEEDEGAHSLPGSFPTTPTIAVAPPTPTASSFVISPPTAGSKALSEPTHPPSVAEPKSTPTEPTADLTAGPKPTPAARLRARAGSWGPALARSGPLDLALAMQLRPGLGAGADPAWMVRFLMAVYGWVVVSVAGGF